VITYEEERAIETLSKEAKDYGVYCWDIVSGLVDYRSGERREMGDPLEPLQAITTLGESSIVFLKDFHRFIAQTEVYRTIKNLIPLLKSTDKHVVIISPVCNIPVELEKDITTLTFELPTEEELVQTAQRIVKENKLKISVDEQAVKAACGLTLSEAENAFALSLVFQKKYDKATIENERLQAVRKSNLMELHNPEPIEKLGGLNNLKKYLTNRKKGFYEKNLPPYAKPHGIILVGPPGTGKSLSAKVCSSIFDIPLVRLDINSLKGSLLGESEKNMSQALNLIRAVAPVVVWMDEFEKTFAGIASSARTDGGTTLGMIGKLMTAMQDFRDEGIPVYWVATVNDIDALIENSQGAMVRRFDDIFFVDFPNKEEREEIIKIMNEKYGSDIPLEWADKMENWTGAEIEKLAFSSLYDGLEEAFIAIRPIYYQCRESIEKARRWAKYNARLANESKQKVQKERKIRV